MTRFSKHKWWIFTAVLISPMVVIAANVPNVFTSGTVISSSQVNANFMALSDRLTAIEAQLGAPGIPDIPNPATATNGAYVAAPAIRLPLYKVTPGESSTNEGGATCNGTDLVVGGGCNGRDTLGTETCMVERNYPISANAWYCRSRKANGNHSDCRATPIAVCLKTF